MTEQTNGFSLLLDRITVLIRENEQMKFNVMKLDEVCEGQATYIAELEEQLSAFRTPRQSPS